ncbi:hypothetical protein KKC00_03210, partial [Patescibacteria group bacterium]|nr:hypothetical protein [Patescibacteria group bacterium]
PIYEWMTYEWKYWFQFTKVDADEKNGNELVDKSLLPSSGKSSILEISSNWRSSPNEFFISIGGIKAYWKKSIWGKDYSNKTIKDVIGVEFSFGPSPDGGNLEFSYISTSYKTLENIVDPSKYRYIRRDNASHTIPLRWTIIIKAGDSYVAIRPIELKKQGTAESLVYEWKYWPAPPSSISLGTPVQLNGAISRVTNKE